MGKYFGTDGFRGEVGVGLTSEHAFKIGRYLGNYLRVRSKDDRRARVVIGKDTRLSSYVLEYAMASGLASSGVDVYLLHVTTTPSVSYVTVDESFDLGVMITASHNPFYDNGIKIIDGEGRKLGDELAAEIEAYLDAEGDNIPFSQGASIGRIVDHYSGRNGYVGHLISMADRSYKGLRIGLDAANGAAFAIARSVFAALGAEVYSIGDEPNGLNVNYECGSTHPERLARAVKERGLDVGFAFDGDADRCIAIDEGGNVVDGDAILYILARALKKRGKLNGDKIALTVMSNGGVIKSLEKEGIGAEITQVGDRFVAERMEDMGLSLGGEQSGHIIISELAKTGDGILTAITITDEIIDAKATLSELYQGLHILPQLSKSISVTDKRSVICDEDLSALLERLKSQNSEHRRIIVRESGTEQKIRIMAESESISECEKTITTITSLLRLKGYINE